MASTHTEIYRRFQGRLRPNALRWWPLFLADYHKALHSKRTLLLLFGPPFIAGVVFSFVVYAKYTVEAGMTPVGGPAIGQMGASALGAMTESLLQVRNMIAQFNIQCRFFAMLVIAWFGAGLIAEDKKAGAHLLYFSRPMTRADYFIGHFLSVATMGLYAVLVPGLMICIVATFSSPEWAFLKNDWELILATIGYSVLFVVTLAALVLAISSLASRKAFALVGVFGVMVSSTAVGVVLSQLKRDPDFLMVSLYSDFQRLGDWMFGTRDRLHDWDPWYSVWIVAGTIAVSVAVCALRLRRLEVVA